MKTNNIIKFIPLALFCIYFTKYSFVLTNASFVECASLCVLGLLSFLFLKEFKDKRLEDIEIKLKELASELQIKNKEISEIKSYLNSIKINSMNTQNKIPTQMKF